MQRLYAELKEMICTALQLEEVTPEQIGDDTLLFGGDGLGLDSVDALELSMEIERRFGVKLRADEVGMTALKNVTSLAAFLRAHARGGAT